MGGRSSKPVRKIKVEPVDEGQTEGPSEEQQDIVQTAQDTLGIATGESNYPDPAPPSHDLPTILEEDEDEAKTISIDDDVQTESMGIAKLQNGGVVPVKVGRSLQKSLSKAANESVHFGLHPNKQRFEYMYDIDSSIGSPLMASSMASLRSSTMAEQQSNLMSNALLQKSNKMALTQRELLLLERESYEYKRLTATPDMTLNLTPRGQVRRYTSFKNNPVIENNVADQTKNKADITASEAAELHKDHRADSFKVLTKDLTFGFKSDVVKVKAIVAWMCKQEIGKIDFGEKRFNPDTPNGYIQLIQEGKGTYPGLFALLCRAADVKCVIINGVSKGAGYEVGGNLTDDLRNTWNAVYIDGGWRLVHPLWVCKSLAGRRPGGWMTIERQGSSRRDVNRCNSGIINFSYNDYFIFTKPEEFVYRHIPDDPKWQLIAEPISLDTFLSRSYFRPAFFINEFRLLSEDKCVLASQEGEAIEVVIGFAESAGSDLVFGYDLSQKLESSSEIIDKQDDSNRGYFQQYVFVSKSKDNVTFEVRFSLTGVYKLRIFGGFYSEYGNNPPWLLEVKLVCNEILPQPQPLPLDPGIVGWGPSPVAESFGLFVPSHEKSVIILTYDDVTVVNFILKQNMNFDISLRHFRIRPGVLEEFLQYEILDLNDILELRIRIDCPSSGEYALKIDILIDGVSENACNYLLQTEAEKPRETFYQRKSRKMLSEAMMSSDISTLTAALKACEESALPLGDPEVMAAERRLQFLQCKEELKFAFLVKRIDKIEVAINNAQQAKLERLFEKEIRRLKNHLKGILTLDKDGWMSKIPEIDRISLMELGQLRQPKQPVKYVIMSMYMLLGVSQEFMTDWTQIKLLLRNTDTTLVEMARLENYLDMDSIEIISIDENTLERVQEVLQTYSEDDIRKIDNTAAAYYIWVKVTHNKLLQHVRIKGIQQSTFSSTVSLKDQTGLVPRTKSVARMSRHQSFKGRKTPIKQDEITRSKSFKTSKESDTKDEFLAGRRSQWSEKVRSSRESAKEGTLQVSENTSFETTRKAQKPSRHNDFPANHRDTSTLGKISVPKPNSSLSSRPNVIARQLTMFSNRGYSGTPGSRMDLLSPGARGPSWLEGIASDPLVKSNGGIHSQIPSRKGSGINNDIPEKNDIIAKSIVPGSSVRSTGKPLSRNNMNENKPLGGKETTRDNSRMIKPETVSRIQTVSTTPGNEAVVNSRPLSNVKKQDTQSTHFPSSKLTRQETQGIQQRKSAASLSPKQANVTTVIARPERQTDTSKSLQNQDMKNIKSKESEVRQSSPAKTSSKSAKSYLSRLNNKIHGNGNAITENKTDGVMTENIVSEKSAKLTERIQTSVSKGMPSLKGDDLIETRKSAVKQEYRKDQSKDQTFIKT